MRLSKSLWIRLLLATNFLFCSQFAFSQNSSNLMEIEPIPIGSIGEKPIGALINTDKPMVDTVKEEAIVLTLREAILISLRYNPAVESGEVQRIVDKYSLRVAFWNYEVHYALTGSATYNYNVSNGTKSESDTQTLVPAFSLLTPIGSQMALEMNNPLSHTSGNARFYNPALRFSIRQPLLKGFGSDVTLAPLHQAQNQELLNRLNLENTVMGTITSVIGQYVSLAQAENSLKVQRISLQNSIDTLKQQEAMLKAGRVAEADLVQFQATVASQQLSLEQQEVNIEQQKLALLTLLGIDPTTQITTTKEVKIENDKLPSLQQCIDMALKNNVAYQQELIALNQSKINLNVATDQQRVTLDLEASRSQGGGGGGSPNSGLRSLFNGSNYDTAVALNLSVPINDQALQQTLVQAKIGLRQEYIRLAALKRQTVNNVINAYNTVLNQKQQIIQARIAVQLAQQSLDVSLAKLKYGRVTPFEVSTLQTNLLSQQISYINAIAAYVTNLSLLDQVISYTLQRWDVQIKY